MDSLSGILIFFLGVLVRIGIPVALTVIVIKWLRYLDARWQEEAEEELAVQATRRVANPGCWKIKGCSSEGRAGCKAFVHSELPCWQVFRSENGVLLEKCLSCQVFNEAPVPLPV